MHTLHSGSCLSDHLPLCFLLQIQSLNSTPSPSPRPAKCLCIDWSKASPADLENYCNITVSSNLPAFPSEVFSCSSTACSCHHDILDTYAQHIVHTLHNCATHCVPSHITSSRRIVGWKDGAGVFKETSNFWHKVWVEAGCPSSGVLFSIKEEGISMPTGILCAGSNTCYRRSWLIHSLENPRRISGLVLSSYINPLSPN